MARLVQDEADLFTRAERVDTQDLCTGLAVDTQDMCVALAIDVGDLHTEVEGGDDETPLYRADTTLLTADNESITADYAL